MNEITKFNLSSINLDDVKKLFSTLDISETTKQDYQNRIKLFIEFIGNTSFNFNSYMEFKNYLRNKNNWSVSTKNKYLITAKVLLNVLQQRGIIPDITKNVKVFSQVKKHKKQGITESEIKTISLNLKNTDTRTQAIITLLTYQGLRQIELTRLDIEDIDLKSGFAFIQGKGQDDKTKIYLHTDTIKALRNYINDYNVKSGALFFSVSNRGKNKRLSTRTIRGIVKTLLNEIGVEKTTHGFRHYFTTRLIKHYNGNIIQVSKYTRHKSLEMLQVYNDDINLEKDIPNFQECFSGILN